MALSRQTKKPTRHRATEPLPGEERLMELPTHELPERGYGLDGTAEKIDSELLLDGRARLNLATFVTTWMPAPASG